MVALGVEPERDAVLRRPADPVDVEAVLLLQRRARCGAEVAVHVLAGEAEVCLERTHALGRVGPVLEVRDDALPEAVPVEQHVERVHGSAEGAEVEAWGEEGSVEHGVL